MQSAGLSSQVNVLLGNVKSDVSSISTHTDQQQGQHKPTLGKDSAEFSIAGKAALAAEENDQKQQNGTNEKSSGADKSNDEKSSPSKELSPVDVATVKDLKQRDQEVRQHEQAHKSAAGSHAAGGPNYEYQTGPDGKRYAVGGHVNIDTGKESDPAATIAKMDTVKRAALAPANPSSQDRAVAAAATQQRNQATIELREIQREEARMENKVDEPDKAENADSASDSSSDDRSNSSGIEVESKVSPPKTIFDQIPLENLAERQRINLSG